MDNIMTQGPIPPDETSPRPNAPLPPRFTPPFTPPSTPPERVAHVAPKRLYRDPHGSVAGVASGMAGYFGVDPVLVRLLWLIAFFSGIGFFAYVLFWVIVPKAPAWPPPGYTDSPASSTGRSSAGSAIVTGLLMVALAAVIGSHMGGLGDFVLPATLVGFGIYLLNQRAATPLEPSAAPPATAFDQTQPASPPQADAVVTEPSGIVTPMVFSVLALAGGIVWALHSFGVIALSLTTLTAGALVVIGAGLIASLWLGRARGLVPLGLGLGAVLLVSSAVERRWHGSSAHTLRSAVGNTPWNVGERNYRVSSIAELQREYSLGLGELTLDLSELDLAGTTQRDRKSVV